MKKYIWLPLIVLLAFQLACVVSLPSSKTGSGNIVTIEEAYSDFEALDISHAFKVEVVQGDTYRVIVHVDDNFVDDLEIVQQGAVLRIGLKPEFRGGLTSATLEAEVTMPELSGIEVSGASQAEVSGFASNSPFSGEVSGASVLRGEIEAGDTHLDVSGAGSAELSGHGDGLTIDVSGGSSVDLANYPVTDVIIDASGASSVTVNVSGTLSVSASGASSVKYLGDPTLGSIDISGASNISPR